MERRETLRISEPELGANGAAPVGWPRFITAPEGGVGPVHFGAADISFQRNTARAEAATAGSPYLVYIAVERWMPDGTLAPIPEAGDARDKIDLLIEAALNMAHWQRRVQQLAEASQGERKAGI